MRKAKMKRREMLVLAAALLGMAGCGDAAGPDVLRPSDVEGTWRFQKVSGCGPTAVQAVIDRTNEVNGSIDIVDGIWSDGATGGRIIGSFWIPDSSFDWTLGGRKMTGKMLPNDHLTSISTYFDVQRQEECRGEFDGVRL
jgi:hypothetical protein